MIPNFEPDDVFEPSHYAGVRRRWDTAETLPGWCYTSPRFYQRERERIFFRYWNCIGHQSRVPEPSSYLAFDFMGVPLIVVRGADREIRAFVNSCPHRGSQIVEGTCTRLQCPYHNWTFALDGSLFATPMFPAIACHEHHLRDDKGARHHDPDPDVDGRQHEPCLGSGAGRPKGSKRGVPVAEERSLNNGDRDQPARCHRQH
jgi:nitrite reductase/ring-hydroxylating ferredoxin subunit